MADPKRRGKRPDTIGWDDVDVDRPASLIRYALVARVDALCQELNITRATVAARLGMTPPNLHQKMSEDGVLRDSGGDFVRSLQWFLQATEERSRTVAGSELVAFRLSTLNRHDAESIRVPSAMLRPLLRSGPARSAEEALVRAAALAGIRSQVDSWADADQLFALYDRPLDDEIRHPTEAVLRDFVVSLSMPWGDTNTSRTIAASLQDWVLPHVRAHLLGSPVGWRSARILVRMLRINENRWREDSARLLVERIEGVLREVAFAGVPPLDPARCFFEEALRRSPGRRDRGGVLEDWAWAWVPGVLEATARDASQPVRRRAYAALCLAERHDSQDRARQVVAALREDPEPGLTYAATALDQYLAGEVTGFGPVPGSDVVAWVRQFCFDRPVPHDSPVSQLPPTVQQATQSLVVTALLSIDTTRRRTACDTLIAAGASGEAAALISQIADHPEAPRFLCDLAAAVLGYLGEAEGLPTLARLASVQDADVVQAAVMALGEIRTDASGIAAAALRSALKSDDEGVQIRGAYSLANRMVRDAAHGNAANARALAGLAKRAHGQRTRAVVRWSQAVAAKPLGLVDPLEV